MPLWAVSRCTLFVTRICAPLKRQGVFHKLCGHQAWAMASTVLRRQNWLLDINNQYPMKSSVSWRIVLRLSWRPAATVRQSRRHPTTTTCANFTIRRIQNCGSVEDQHVIVRACFCNARGFFWLSTLLAQLPFVPFLKSLVFCSSPSLRLALGQSMRIILRNGGVRSLTASRILALELSRRKHTTAVWVAVTEVQPRL